MMDWKYLDPDIVELSGVIKKINRHLNEAKKIERIKRAQYERIALGHPTREKALDAYLSAASVSEAIERIKIEVEG
ncbi:MAG TPA: hypothetical protein VLH56_11445 [Dissulfurispiraceae bacterium]|nr:hypothetical protein [Dissulfurispiraceae bacterium]